MRPVLVATNNELLPEPEPALVLSTDNYHTPAPPPLPPQDPVSAPVATDEKSRAFMDMIEAIALILSARAILLLTLAGAFILAVSAMFDPTVMRLGILCSYCVLAVLPCVWLETRK
jgi:hypothetical protein